MTRRTAATVVLDDGEIVEAGTPATAALEKAIPNSAAWVEDEQPAEPAESKAKRK